MTVRETTSPTRDPSVVAEILDSLDEGVLTLGDDGHVLDINRAACEILEVEKATALHRTCLTLLGEEVCKQSSRVRQSIADRQPIQGLRAEIRTASGREKVLQLRTRILRDRAGAPHGGLVVFRDISELATLQRDLDQRYSLRDIIGKSKQMRDVFSLIEQVADSDASVLLEGETGTGKELAARAIHALSPRAAGPFVAVNCSALPETLLESELFGYVKGAFTGAQRDKRGRFEAAHGGTIFLDEVGDISAAIQVKLLRVLQERIVEPVGAEQQRPVDLRVISATNKPLAELTAYGTFRQDLYYRLRVVPIWLPPLRARRDDIPLLAHHFVRQFRGRTGREIEGVDAGALAALLRYDWPGNVRELENAIEYAFVQTRAGEIELPHLPPEVRSFAAGAERRPIQQRGRVWDPVGEALAEQAGAGTLDGADAGAESAATLAALQWAGWNISKAARRLGISRTTLYKRIRAHGLKPGRDK